MTDLWSEASRDVEAEERTLAYHRASAALEGLWPWLAVAQSEAELEHRKALAAESLQSIASSSGMTLPEVGEMINRRFALVSEAMRKQAEEEEGGEWYVEDKNTGAKVAGPFGEREQAQEAIENNDSGLPASELTIVHESSEPEEEGEEGEGKEASRHHALTEGENILAETVIPASGSPMPEKPLEHDEEPDPSIPPEARNHIPDAVAARRTAAEGTPPPPDGPPQPDEGEDAQEGPEEPGEFTGDQEAIPQTTKPRQMPGDGGSDSLGTSEDGESEGDPVGDQVDTVAEAVRKHNPHLDEVTCRRVARKVVARHVQATGDDGIDYVNREPEDKRSGEEAAAGMAGRKILDELPLLEV